MSTRQKNKKFMALFLIFSLVTLSGNLMAKEKHGAELVIQTKEGHKIRGELIAVKENSLLLLDSEGTDVSVDIGDISVIKIVKKSQGGTGALIGLLVGAVIGTAMVAADNAKPSSGWIDIKIPAHYGAILGLPGALVGAVIGSVASSDKTIQIEGKSDLEIKEILEKLRSKARVPDYQ